MRGCHVWFLSGLSPQTVQCEVCPAVGGALKPSEFYTKQSSITIAADETAATPPGSDTKAQPSSKLSGRAARRGEVKRAGKLQPQGKRSQRGGRARTLPRTGWAHVTCALFLPELYFKDKLPFDVVCGISKLKPERLRLHCMVCAAADKAGSSGVADDQNEASPMVTTGCLDDGERMDADTDPAAVDVVAAAASSSEAIPASTSSSSAAVSKKRRARRPAGVSACLQCCRPRCAKAFHAECARQVCSLHL